MQGADRYMAVLQTETVSKSLVIKKGFPYVENSIDVINGIKRIGKDLIPAKPARFVLRGWYSLARIRL